MSEFIIWFNNFGKDIGNATAELRKNIENTTAEWNEELEKVKNELIKTLDEKTKKLFDDFYSEINKFKKDGEYEILEDNEKTEYDNWVSFINTFFIYKCENKECKIEEYFKETEDNVGDEGAQVEIDAAKKEPAN
jgi:hypothetical protein